MNNPTDKTNPDAEPCYACGGRTRMFQLGQYKVCEHCDGTGIEPEAKNKRRDSDFYKKCLTEVQEVLADYLARRQDGTKRVGILCGTKRLQTAYARLLAIEAEDKRSEAADSLSSQRSWG